MISYNNHHVCLYLLLLLLLSVQLVSYAAAQSRNGSPRPPPPPPPPINETQNFKPSMLVVIIVLITAFFFMGFFSIYLRQCVSENSTGIGGSIRRQTIGLRSRRVQKGLDPELINTFPIFLYSEVKGLKIGKGTLECAVCLNEFEDDETLRLLPKCDHVFHPDCIDAWLASHTTCPVCRCDLKEVISGEETVEEAAAVPVNEDVSSENQERSIQSPEISESQEQVLIRVIDRDDEEDEEINNNNNKQSEISHPDVINPLQIPIQNRFRSKSTRPRIASKFPRSHSTGHSLVQPGDNVERFTLRLPEDVRKQIVADAQLNRAASYAEFQTRQRSVSGSSHGSRLQGLRGGSQGSGAGRSGKYFQFGRLDRAAKSDHWGFKLTIPFFTRNPSVRSPKISDGSVKSAFDNGVGAKSAGDGGGSGTTTEQSQTNSTSAAPRPPV